VWGKRCIVEARMSGRDFLSLPPQLDEYLGVLWRHTWVVVAVPVLAIYLAGANRLSASTGEL
jgi:hypothetical protein